MKLSVKILKELGAKAVIIKGGHLEGDKAIDILLENNNFHMETCEKINIEKEVHGTGCIFSSALTTFLAMVYNYYNAFIKAQKII